MIESSKIKEEISNEIDMFIKKFPRTNFSGNIPIDPSGAGLSWTEEASHFLHLIRKLNNWASQLDMELKEFTQTYKEELLELIETFNNNIYDTTVQILKELIEAGEIDEAISRLIGVFDRVVGDVSGFRDFDTTLIQKMSNEFTERTVNVKWFGTIGDGDKDDTQAFINAINYCKNNKVRMLFIPPCKNFYKITKELEFRKAHEGMKIVGCGKLSPFRLISPNSRGHFIGILGDNNEETDWIDGFELSNLMLSVTYSKINYPQGIDNAIGISKAKNVKIKDIYVDKSPWKGITIQYFCKNIIIEDCIVENCYDYGIGAEFSTVENIKFIRCQANKNGKQGILITSAGDGGYIRGAEVESCTTSGNELEGLGLNYCDTAITRYNQSFDNKGAGIKYRRCVRSSSQSDKSVSNNLTGIHVLEGSHNVISGVDSRNNSLVDNDERGNVFFENSPSCQFINGVANTGIRSMTNHSENLLVTGCLLTGTTKVPLKTALAEQTERSAINADGTVVARLGAVPTLGSWRRGDIVWTTTPLQDMPPGWVCVANGSPGLWRALSKLSLS